MRTSLLSLYFAVATMIAMAAPAPTPMSEFMISTGWTLANVDNALIARAFSKAGFTRAAPSTCGRPKTNFLSFHYQY